MGVITDPATGRQAHATVSGRFAFVAQGNPAALVPQLNAALVQATQRVITHKLQTNQVAIPTLAQSLPHFTSEIVQNSGIAQMGVQLQQIELAISLDWTAVPQQPAPQPQYEVRGELEIGGFNLKASSSGGFDAQGLADQATDKARSEITWWIIMGVVVIVAILGAIGMGIYIYLESKKTSNSDDTAESDSKKKEASWDGSEPFSCKGNEKPKLEGVKAKLDKGVAVTASGNCKLELIDVEIDAPTGIVAEGNAIITVKGGNVTGKDFAAKTSANGQITFSGTKVNGKKEGKKIEGP